MLRAIEISSNHLGSIAFLRYCTSPRTTLRTLNAWHAFVLAYLPKAESISGDCFKHTEDLAAVLMCKGIASRPKEILTFENC
jgi:hypothetical protein